jgi:hypothetical protein
VYATEAEKMNGRMFQSSLKGCASISACRQKAVIVVVRLRTIHSTW